MAHFAEIRSDNNIVLRVIVVGNHQEQQYGGFNTPELEQWVASFHPNDPVIKAELGGVYPQTYWKQTSYNTRAGKYYNSNGELSTDQSKAFRKNYAGVGYTYDLSIDAYIPPKPFNSWVLNLDTGIWDPPIPRPSTWTYGDNQPLLIAWDEENQKWIGTDNNNNKFNWIETSKSWIATGV
jgi:hypothetical protein